MRLDGEILAPAERAAHTREMDPHLLGLEAEARGDLVAVDMRPLRRDVDVDAALPVRDREAGLRAEERLILLAELVVPGDGDVACRIRVCSADRGRAHDVRPRVLA